MADFQPLKALQYDLSRAGDADDLISPPYDVVSAAESAALYQRSPFNIARVDFGPELAGDDGQENRYKRAGRELQAWRQQGILKLDEQPRLYAYDQEFEVHGRRHSRRAVFGRLRIEDWDSGIVLPHEHTRARDKQDRLDLLRVVQTNTSPIMAMYEASSEALRIEDGDLEAPLIDATLSDERHVLRALTPEAAARFSAAIAAQPLYIADGHHRYETALNYRNEVKAARSDWTGEEPENFVLAAVLDAADPGLVVLPIHRLVKLESKDGLIDKLSPLFNLEAMGDLAAAQARLQSAQGIEPAFVAAGLEAGAIHFVTIKDKDTVEGMIPAESPAAWRSLDVALIHYALLAALGFEQTPDNIAFTEDAEEAVAEVSAGAWDLALLMNPTPVDQIISVAGAGERMPQKSTFFYPKLGTGLVLYPHDQSAR